jgi:phage regulator Rha-like protein
MLPEQQTIFYGECNNSLPLHQTKNDIISKMTEKQHSHLRRYIDSVGELIPKVIASSTEHVFYGHEEFNVLYGMNEWTWFKGLGKKVKMAVKNGTDRH